MRHHTSLLALAALLCCTLPQPLSAQEAAQRLSVSERDGLPQNTSPLLYKTPRGWVRAKTPKGSALLLRSASEGSSQIEVKITPELESDQHKSYLASFHANLIRAGFEDISRERPAPDLTSFAGSRNDYFSHTQTTTYAVTSDNQRFLMIVWAGWRDDRTWQVIAFFPDYAWDLTIQPLSIVVSSLSP
jgi:hypothetical protein